MRPFTTEEIATWFKEISAGKRLVPPNAAQCGEMASLLNVIMKRNRAVKRGELTIPEHQKNNKKLIEHGEKFAECLSILREAQTAALAECKLPQNVKYILDLMEKTEASVREIVQMVDVPLPDFSDDENAHFIAEAAQEAWASSGRAPRSTAAEDPLVAFVARAMNAIEAREATVPKKFKKTAIRDWLAGHRRQRKVWRFPESILPQVMRPDKQ